MAQRYQPGPAHQRMAAGLCPECGLTPEAHSTSPNFWERTGCDLMPRGVEERIEQYRDDVDASAYDPHGGQKHRVYDEN